MLVLERARAWDVLLAQASSNHLRAEVDKAVRSLQAERETRSCQAGSQEED